MFDENGFRNDAAETSGLSKPENGRDQVNNEKNPDGACAMVQEKKTSDSGLI